jgi:hypothetical protein
MKIDAIPAILIPLTPNRPFGSTIGQEVSNIGPITEGYAVDSHKYVHHRIGVLEDICGQVIALN